MARDMDEMLTWDKQATKERVENMLYKVAEYRNFGEINREAALIASYELREGSSGGSVSKPTENIATYNVDANNYAKKYDRLLKMLMDRMPEKQRLVIEHRYLHHDPKKDSDVANKVVFLGHNAYSQLKSKAMYRIASVLNLQVFLIPCDSCGDDSSRKDLIKGVCKKCRTKEPGQ